MASERDLLSALEQAEREYYSAGRGPHRVIGIGVGPKIQADQPQYDKLSLRFYVERKIRPLEAVDPKHRIRADYEGLPTDVVETGHIVPLQAGPGSSLGLDFRGLAPNIDPALNGTLG